MTRALQIVSRLVPVVGLIVNRIRFPGLKAGLGVTVEGRSAFRYGCGVSFGEGSRVENIEGDMVIGDGVSLSRDVHLVSSAGRSLQIGARSVIQDGCRIYGDVHIGRRCIFAPNIFVSSGTHMFDAIPAIPIQFQERMFPADPKAVRIGDDCWLGVNTVVSRGVTIGRGCVVGANSVVTRDVAPYSVVAGNPARIIRQRLAFVPKSKIDASVDDDIPYFYEGFEFSPQPRTCIESPDGSFVIAIRKYNAIGVQLHLSGEGQVRFGTQTAAVPKEPGIVKFNIAESVSQDFLVFSSEGPCRIYGAELF